MRVTGDAMVHAEPVRVYAALGDPAVLVRAIPGCRSVRATGAGRYELSVTSRVASIEGTYDGEAVLTEREPPERFALHVRASGTPGTVDAAVHVRLSPDGAATRVAYEVDATVGGMVGGVGRRLLESVARSMAAELLTALDRSFTASAVPDLSGSDRAMALPHPDKTVIGAAVTVGASVAAGFVLGWWARSR